MGKEHPELNRVLADLAEKQISTVEDTTIVDLGDGFLTIIIRGGDNSSSKSKVKRPFVIGFPSGEIYLGALNNHEVRAQIVWR